MFKRGDRVKLVSPRYTWVHLAPGSTGTILRDLDAGDIVGVQFDNWQGGHNAEGLIADNSAWFVSQEDLEPCMIQPLTPEATNESHPTGTPTQSTDAAQAAQGDLRDVQASARRGGDDQGSSGTGVRSGKTTGHSGNNRRA